MKKNALASLPLIAVAALPLPSSTAPTAAPMIAPMTTKTAATPIRTNFFFPLEPDPVPAVMSTR